MQNPRSPSHLAFQNFLLGWLVRNPLRSFGAVTRLTFHSGVFLASADKSILLTTQTQIASSLHSPSNAALLLVSYNLGFCVALPVVSIVLDYFFQVSAH
jgi:hypothetical protein